MTPYIILLALLFCSFFFSGSETAITAASGPLLHDEEKAGNPRAKKLNRLKKNPDKLLSTLLFGNNVVNIALTALATAILIDWLGDYWGILVSTAVVSFVVLVFADILPKTYAMTNPTRIALFVTPAVSFLIFCTAPAVRMLNGISRQVMRFLPRPKNKKSADDQLRAEIRGTIEMQKEKDVLPQEKGMLKNVLDLGATTVGDIMVPRDKIIFLDARLPAPNLFEIMSKTPHSFFPVLKGKNGRVAGVLRSRRAWVWMQSVYQKRKDANILNYCSKPWFVRDTTPLTDQLHAFKKRHEHGALVVDERGSLQGLITLKDVLEEIVGGIIHEREPARRD